MGYGSWQAGVEAVVRRLKISDFQLSAGDCVPNDASQLRPVYSRHDSRTLFCIRKAWLIRYLFRSFVHAESNRYSENYIKFLFEFYISSRFVLSL